MADALGAALKVAASGLNAQSQRMEITSQNLANVHSTAEIAGGTPYLRKSIQFRELVSDQFGASMVGVRRVSSDEQAVRVVHNPEHPAADERGFVKIPDINVMTELADMREASRSFEANLQVIRQARGMVSSLIDVLRTGS